MSIQNIRNALPARNPVAPAPRLRIPQHGSRPRVRLGHIGPSGPRVPLEDADTRVCHYPDTVQIWTRKPLHPRLWAIVIRNCGSIYDEHGPRKDDWRWQHRYLLHQPKVEALAQFRHLQHEINWVEFARDQVSGTKRAKLALDEFMHCHIRIVGKDPDYVVNKREDDQLTRYSGDGSWDSNQLVTYVEDHCRMTGEMHCNHWEWRTKGGKFVKRKGIRTVDDLLAFDHAAFWAKILREVYAIDLERLGRIMRNRQNETKSKKPLIVEWIKGRPFNLDKYRGNLTARACARTNTSRLPVPCIVQDLVDKHGMKLIRRALIRMHWTSGDVGRLSTLR